MVDITNTEKPFIWNYSRDTKLYACQSCGGKPELVATHVRCSNPRCEYFSNPVRDSTWNRDYRVDGVTDRAARTWEGHVNEHE